MHHYFLTTVGLFKTRQNKFCYYLLAPKISNGNNFCLNCVLVRNVFDVLSWFSQKEPWKAIIRLYKASALFFSNKYPDSGRQFQQILLNSLDILGFTLMYLILEWIRIWIAKQTVDGFVFRVVTDWDILDRIN